MHAKDTCWNQILSVQTRTVYVVTNTGFLFGRMQNVVQTCEKD